MMGKATAGAALSFLGTTSGGVPCRRCFSLHQRPPHLLFLPVLGEILGGSEAPAPLQSEAEHPWALQPGRAQPSPVWPGGESGLDISNWIRLIFKTEINWHLEESNVLLFQLAFFIIFFSFLFFFFLFHGSRLHHIGSVSLGMCCWIMTCRDLRAEVSILFLQPYKAKKKPPGWLQRDAVLSSPVNLSKCSTKISLWSFPSRQLELH